MRYFLDCEFDGKGGPLLTLALVRDDGVGFYFVDPTAVAEARDEWVRANVAPVVDAGPLGFHISNIGLVLSQWLREDRKPIIVADWPDDIAYLCREMTARSLYWTDPNGQLYDMPPLRFEVANHDAYPTTLPGAVQHNAWWDAMALRHLLIGQEGRSADDARSIAHTLSVQADQPQPPPNTGREPR